MKIHTDTNILYDLNLNPTTINELKFHGVTINYINMFEIMKTNPNNKLSNVDSAYRNSTPFIETAIQIPSLYECIEIGTGTKINDPHVFEWVREFEKIATSDLDISKIVFTEIDKDDNVVYNSLYTDPYKVATDAWNKEFKICQSKGKLFSETGLYDIFNIGVKAQTGKELPKEEFLRRELFLSVFIDFANEIILNVKKEHKKRTVMKTNDYLDLMILLYVKKGDKIWTSEIEWIERIKRLFPYENYLFLGDKFLKNKQ